ncbi:hypothetical protein LBMAG56_00700 [Verrucomicrobiota bacterium]|nr:hypothetical protein LBMAG56_00700 [Verrucomicrobiota bacterium]
MKELMVLWDRFFFARVDARPMGLFRIAFGAYLLVFYWQLKWILELYFLKSGFAVHFAAKPAVSFPNGLFVNLANVSPTWFYFLYGATFAIIALFTLGLWTRIAAVLLWVVTCAWLGPLVVGSNSADNVVRTLSFLFMLAAVAGHANTCYSLDAHRARSASEAGVPQIPVWSTRLFQVQLALIYFFSGFHKLASNDWYNGSALHYVFFQATWSRVDLSWATNYPFATGLLTYATLFYELLLFPALVWNRRTRLPILTFGILLHLSIAVTMKVFVFGEIMLLFYLCFLTQEHYDCLRGFWRKCVVKVGKQGEV